MSELEIRGKCAKILGKIILQSSRTSTNQSNYLSNGKCVLFISKRSALQFDGFGFDFYFFWAFTAASATAVGATSTLIQCSCCCWDILTFLSHLLSSGITLTFITWQYVAIKNLSIHNVIAHTHTHRYCNMWSNGFFSLQNMYMCFHLL